ncbi:uridine diphosphate glucose pyrophosphatase NUDT14-like [Chrysoperla carnea]|uniref:uridine diphosphate glucose pyrophosphatase NUDT14-like n=1 Tax=Chrysoperla carnea TaxID=189513 RepID=UPI001D07C0BE|nr:uridine diphosphate glucose pyrophosphatase NUDT14-like [Chrysoperla carnea]
MEKVTDVSFSPLENSQYIRPLRINFTQNGVKKNWDLMAVHDSVVIVLFNVTRKKLIFVKQFRPAVYYSKIPASERKETIDTKKYSPKLGITLELCAGIVDKNKSIDEIAREEILEECGYDVPLNQIHRILKHCVNPGVLGCGQTFFYAEVTDDMKVSEGGGVDDELIEVVELSVDELKAYIHSDEINSPPGFLFGVHWFLLNKPQYAG